MCDVSITNVVATGSPNPDQITVTVAVDECKLLAVTLDGITKTAEVLEQPVIVVDFVAGVDYDPDRFVCDRSVVRVEARCTDVDADCPPSVVTLDPLACDDRCPTVDIDVLDVGDCVDGQRPVTLRATVFNAPDPTVYTWAYGNGADESALLSGTQVQVTQSFPASTTTPFTTSFGFILPEDCPPTVVEIGPFPECPAACPSATIEVRGIGECIGGQRTVSYRVSVTAATDPVTFSVDHGDGTFGPPQAVAAGGAVSSDHTYTFDASAETGPATTYTMRVVAVPEITGCPGTLATVDVAIEPCVVDCTANEAILDVALGECGDNDPTRPVTATASTDAAEAPVSYEWVWSDGTELTTVQPTMTHTFGAADAGEGSVAVRAVWSNGCSDLATIDVDVQRCNDCPAASEITAAVGPCLADGTRPVTFSVDLSGTAGGPITWELGDGTQLTSAEATSPPVVVSPGAQSVTTTIPGGAGCDDVVVTARVDVPQCPPPPPPPPLCEFFKIVGLIALIVGLVLIFGGFCAGEGVVMAIGASIAAVGFIILVLWAILCAGLGGGCLALQRVIEVLELLTIVLGVIAVVLGIFGVDACAIGAIVDAGIAGVLLAVLSMIFRQVGCQIRRPTLPDSIFS